MENKDIILFILTICVIYLLYCNKNKNHESFPESTSGISGRLREAIVEEITKMKNEITNKSITESIKNLGLLAKEIQDNNGAYRFPADLTAAKFIASGQIDDAKLCIRDTCIDEDELKTLK
tara:strand:+ start:64 stop:426 length:363 start_codon:yes stop_codon:yes gene_type:complete